MTDNDVWIYLSYAHDDDAPTSASDDERGFVTSLRSDARAQAPRSRSKTNKDLAGNVPRANSGDQAPDVANDGLRKADLMLVVMSRNWMERPYCRRELEAFISFRKKAGVSNVAERVIVVGKGYVDRFDAAGGVAKSGGLPFLRARRYDRPGRRHLVLQSWQNRKRPILRRARPTRPNSIEAQRPDRKPKSSRPEARRPHTSRSSRRMAGSSISPNRPLT